ncbi:hypothetical protein SDRG_08093, partial [Saprolegnia diclina VS20]
TCCHDDTRRLEMAIAKPTPDDTRRLDTAVGHLRG